MNDPLGAERGRRRYRRRIRWHLHAAQAPGVLIISARNCFAIGFPYIHLEVRWIPCPA